LEKKKNFPAAGGEGRDQTVIPSGSKLKKKKRKEFKGRVAA